MTNPNNNPYGADGQPGNAGENAGGLPSYGGGSANTGDYQSGANPSGASSAGGYQEPDFSSYAEYQGYAGENQQGPVKKSGMALAAFIIGLICLPAMLTAFSIVPGVIGLIVAIIALVRNRKKPKEARRTWMSVVGPILSILGIIATVAVVGLVAVIMGDPAVQACWENSATQEDFQACFNSLVE